MRHDLLQLAAQLSRRGEPFALATVVNREPPISTQVGDAAIVTAGGGFHGWVGGSCTRPTVIAEAARALAEGTPRFIALAPEPPAAPRPGVSTFPMTCHSGGSVEIYIEPVLPAPRLRVYGSSPVAQSLIAVGSAMGYATEPVAPGLEPAPASGRAPLFAVIATMGELDEDAIAAAIAARPVYLGVIASRRRFAELRTALIARGVPAEEIDAIRNPAGLDIGARRPEEIAVSVLAEIVQLRSALDARPDLGHRSAPADAAGPTHAIDPVCGMQVEIATARHVAEQGGTISYFCCAGCRERFLAAPAPRRIPLARVVE